MEELMTKLNELAPEAIEQMLAYGLFCNWIGVVVCSLLILGYAGVAWLCFKNWGEDVAIPALSIGGVIMFFTVTILIGLITELCEIYYWPYAYIINALT